MECREEIFMEAYLDKGIELATKHPLAFLVFVLLAGVTIIIRALREERRRNDRLVAALFHLQGNGVELDEDITETMGYRRKRSSSK